jgi:hypothetical protein
LIGAAKDSFMRELSQLKNQPEEAQKNNTGNYFKELQVDNLIKTYSVNIKILCEPLLTKRRNEQLSRVPMFFKWLISLFK